MRVIPHQVHIVRNDVVGLSNSGKIDDDRFYRADSYFTKCVRYFGSPGNRLSYSDLFPVFTSGKNIIAKIKSYVLSRYQKCLTPSLGVHYAKCLDMRYYSEFEEVLNKSQSEWDKIDPQANKMHRSKPRYTIKDMPFCDMVNQISSSAHGLGQLRCGYLHSASRNVNSFFTSVVAATQSKTPHNVGLNILSLGARALSEIPIDGEMSESRVMVSSVTGHLHLMIKASVESLGPFGGQEEVALALKDAFDPSWFKYMRLGMKEAYGAKEYGCYASISLISAVQYNSYLYIANSGSCRSFLWKNEKLAPLNFVDPSSSLRTVDNSSDETTMNSTAKSDFSSNDSGLSFPYKHNEPYVSCVPLNMVKGGFLLLSSPGILETIGSFGVSKILMNNPVPEYIFCLFTEARMRGFEGDAEIAVVPFMDTVEEVVDMQMKDLRLTNYCPILY